MTHLGSAPLIHTYTLDKEKNKQIILRVLSQISDNEIQLLGRFFRKSSQNNHVRLSPEDLAEDVSWQKLDIILTCNGLTQLQLVEIPTVEWDELAQGRKTSIWAISQLGLQVSRFAMARTEPEK